jgi:hypothetical protein
VVCRFVTPGVYQTRPSGDQKAPDV